MTFHLQTVHFPTAEPDGPAIALVSQAAYHLDELIPIGRALCSRGFAPTLYLTEGAKGAQRLRAQHRRFLRSVKRLTHFGMRIAGEQTETINPGVALVAMTDWEIMTPFLAAAAAAGAASFAKVEGAQDFADDNTGRTRHPYRNADVILCQGLNDFQALADTNRHIVGNSRIQTVLESSPTTDHQGPVVINSNFSYGVQTEHRKLWVNGAIDACRAADRKFVISQHPADRGLSGLRHRSLAPVESLLDDASGLITRFSSLGFEALARGVPLHYFNVHGEATGPFADPEGAFAVTTSTTELTEQLQAPPPAPLVVRDTANSFLQRQFDVTPTPPGERAAAIIASTIS